jgi:hypothetical protein
MAISGKLQSSLDPVSTPESISGFHPGHAPDFASILV